MTTGEKEETQIHEFTFILCLQFNSKEAKASLTALAFFQGTLCSLMQGVRHKEEHAFLNTAVKYSGRFPGRVWPISWCWQWE